MAHNFRGWLPQDFTACIPLHEYLGPLVERNRGAWTLEAFTPAPEAVAEARELIAEFEAHRARGLFAFTFKGRMVDAPHLTRAVKLLARAGDG